MAAQPAKAPVGAPAGRTFWRNLNVFIAVFVLGVAAGRWVLMVPTALVLRPFMERQRAEIVALPPARGAVDRDGRCHIAGKVGAELRAMPAEEKAAPV